MNDLGKIYKDVLFDYFIIEFMKGGNMKTQTKRILALSMLFMFVSVLAVSLVAADSHEEAGAQKKIENPKWLLSFVNFMGFGETWSTLIISLAVLVMIFAAAFDILAFSAFESRWVKYLIAGGIAVVVSVSRGVTLITATLMSIAGGSVAIAVVIAIVMAVVFFLIGTFFKGRLKSMKLKQKAQEAEGAYELGKATKVAEIKAAKAAAKAAEE